MSSIIGDLTGAAASTLLQRTFLIQSNTPTGIPRILCVFDAVLEEAPQYSADVTQHPVEEGPEVSDHIQLKNPTLRIVGTISNSPIDLQTTIGNLLAGGTAFFTSSQFRSNILNSGIGVAAPIIGAKLLKNASNAAARGTALAGAADALARNILLNAYEQKQPFDVMTKRQKYSNMVIQSMKFPRDTRTGYQLVFELEMIALRIVTPISVQINTVAENVTSSATSKASLGGQSTKEISSQATSQVNGSWLRKIIKGV